MYPSSPLFLRLVLRTYKTIVQAAFLITRRVYYPFPFAPQDMIKPIRKTDKEHYGLERKNYRLARHIVMSGQPLYKRDYYLYSLIAKKYNWPYIKETYDTLPD